MNKSKQILFARVLNYLGVKARSEHEIRSYLHTKAKILSKKNEEDIPETIIEDIVKEVKELKLIDDEDYVETYLYQINHSSKPTSPSQARNFLMRKGISQNLIGQKIDMLETSHIDQNIQKLLEKKWNSSDLRKITDQRLKKQKLLKFIVSKGYPFDRSLALIDTYFKLP